MTNSELLVSIASKYVGIKSTDPIVSDFRKSVCNIDSGQPWCVDFIWYCLNKIKQKSDLPKTESSNVLWTKCNPSLRIARPEIGCLMLWFYEGTDRGHAGIVTNVNMDAGYVSTVEGNTTGAQSVDRIGDGVYKKIRHIIAPPGNLQVLGWLRCWNLVSIPMNQD